MFPGVPFNDDGAQLYPYELSRLGCFSSKVAPSPSASPGHGGSSLYSTISAKVPFESKILTASLEPLRPKLS